MKATSTKPKKENTNELQSVSEISKKIAQSEKFLIEERYNTHLFPTALYWDVKGRMDALLWVMKLQPWIKKPKRSNKLNKEMKK